MEPSNRCPICLDSLDNNAYVMPCFHQFCYACILRWVETKPECPLCKRRIASIVHSVRADDDFEEQVIPPPAASLVRGHQAGGAPGRLAAQSPAATEHQAVGMVARAPLGGLHPHMWACLFQDHPALLQLLRPWVHQELRVIFRNGRSQAAVVEELVMSALGLFGLHEEVLVRLLRVSLQNHTAMFVQCLIDVTVQRCSGDAHRLLDLEEGQAAEEQEGRLAAAPHPAASQRGSLAPGPAPSGSPVGADEDQRPSTSTAALCGGASSPPSAPVPTHGEQEEQREDLGEAVGGPAIPGRGRDHSPGGPRRPLKRRASTSQDSCQPCKRPPRRQK